MSKLRVISDIHGCIDNRIRFNDLPSYIELCQELWPDDYSVQLGDMGFQYQSITNSLDPSKHVFIKGNHDDHDEKECPNALGRYGLCELGPFNFFYVCGGFSIDCKQRIANEILTGVKSWWKSEELTQAEGLACLELYEKVKPEVVLSHECPASISYILGNPDIMQAFGWKKDLVTSTQELMEQMIKIHKPKLWLNAHYHVDRKIKYHNTIFICQAERRFLDFDEKWNIISDSLSDERAHIFL
jgi:hypothetical protein